MKMRLEWKTEAIARGQDRAFGAALRQLTSAALVSHNIYCEERYTSADGHCLAFLRGTSEALSSAELWVCNLLTGEVARVSTSIQGFPTSNMFRDTLFYVRTTGNSRVLTRLNLATFEQDDVFDMTGCPFTRYHMGTISPDERHYVGRMRVSGNVWGLYRCDLERGTWEPFHEHVDICNPHPQFEPSCGHDILVQLNQGSEIDEEENIIRLVGTEGATLYVIDRDGGNYRPLPVGIKHDMMGGVTGHECWVGATQQIVLTAGDYANNAVYIVGPNDTKARCLWRGVRFNHISASVDGKYFVTDDWANGWLYVGNIQTGRMLPLCDSGSSMGAPQYTHPHAYMTPGNRHVVFNSDRTGLAQVWLCELPSGFLEILDHSRE